MASKPLLPKQSSLVPQQALNAYDNLMRTENTTPAAAVDQQQRQHPPPQKLASVECYTAYSAM